MKKILTRFVFIIFCFLVTSVNKNPLKIQNIKNSELENLVNIQDSIFLKINKIRVNNNLKPLVKTIHPQEYLFAQKRMNILLQQGRDFNHQMFKQHAVVLGLSGVYENIDYIWIHSEKDPVSRWMSSETHRENILNPNITHTIILVYKDLEINEIGYLQVFFTKE